MAALAELAILHKKRIEPTCLIGKNKNNRIDEFRMICLRCGCCCVYLDVAIVNPGAIRQDGTIDPEHCEPVIFKPKGQLCPHLVYLKDNSSCKIHELPCYRGTPCEQFEQLGREDDVCVMNGYYRLFEGHPSPNGSHSTSKKIPKLVKI